jgi:hypothetical protein
MDGRRWYEAESLMADLTNHRHERVAQMRTVHPRLATKTDRPDEVRRTQGGPPMSNV